MNLRSFVVAGVIAAVLVITPTPSSAATVAQLQAQLNALLAQLAALQSQQGNADENDAEDAIQDAENAIEDAEDAIDDSDASNADIDDAEELVDEANDLLDDAEEAFDDEDYDDAIDYAEEAIDLANEAEDIANEDGNNDDENDAEDTINDAENAVDDANDAIDDSNASNSDINEAEDLVDEANDLIDEANDEFDDENYDDAIDLAEEAIDLAEEAEDLANNDGGGDEDDAEDAIQDAEDDVHAAQNTLNNSDASGSDQNEAEDLIEEAEELIDEAWDEFDDENYDDAMDLADEASELAEEAMDLANNGGDDSNPNDVCIALTRELSVGSSGDDVKQLQRFLGVSVTGYYGTLTRDAVAAFQSHYGISPANGSVGVITRAKINSMSSGTDCDPDDGDVRVTFNGGTFTTKTPTLTGDGFGVSAFKLTILSGNDAILYQTSNGAVHVEDDMFWSHKVTSNLPNGTFEAVASNASGTRIGSGTLQVNVTATTTTKGTYIGYLNGSQFIKTLNITKEDALANCKLNARNNLTSSVRCTWNGEEIYNRTVASTAAPTITLSAAPTALSIGQATTIKWVATNATSCGLGDGTTAETAIETTGSKAIKPTKTTTYTVTCVNDPSPTTDGPVAKKTVTVTVSPTPATPGITFTASPTSVLRGHNSTLSWSVKNATSCSLSYGSSKETVARTSTKVVTPNVSTSYTLSCANNVIAGKKGPVAAKVVSIPVAVPTTSNQQASVLSAMEAQLADLTAQLQALLGH